MAHSKDAVASPFVSSGQVSEPISTSTCAPLSAQMTPKSLGCSVREVDAKEELALSTKDSLAFEYPDIAPSDSSKCTPILGNLSPMPQAPEFLVGKRKLGEMPDIFYPTVGQQQHASGHALIGESLSASLSSAYTSVATSATLISATPSLSSIDDDLITQALAWLDRDTPELTLSVTPFAPDQQWSSPSTSESSVCPTPQPGDQSSNGPHSSDEGPRSSQPSVPSQLANPSLQQYRYPDMTNLPTLEACDETPESYYDVLRLSLPWSEGKSRHVCSKSSPCQPEISPRHESPWPAILSATWAVLIPLGCLLCNGYWLVAPSEKAPVGKVVLVLYCYLICIMLSSMWKAAWSNPGTIPRNLDPDPQLDSEEERSPTQAEHKMKEAQSLTNAKVQSRWVNIGDYIVPMKWCRRCQSYRPPRASHCRICDYCVQQADHHCTFLNNCIGRRNYFVFLTFLFSTTVAMLSTLAISISHLVLIPNIASHPEAIGNCVVISLALLLGLPVMCLLVFHLRLISRNVTTMERVSGLASPFP